MNTADKFTRPVNLGNPTEWTIGKLAEKVIAWIDLNSKLVHKPFPSDDPRQRQFDIALARPGVTLEDGLTKTIAYFAEVLPRGPRHGAAG